MARQLAQRRKDAKTRRKQGEGWCPNWPHISSCPLCVSASLCLCAFASKSQLLRDGLLGRAQLLRLVLDAGRFRRDQAQIDFKLLEGLVGENFFGGLLALDIDDAFARQVGGDADLGPVEADL